MSVTAGIFTLLGLALVGAAAAVFLRESRLPTAALLVSLAAGALILLGLLPSLRRLVDAFSALGESVGADGDYLRLILKIVGLAYLAEFCAQLCRDAGQGAAAFKIELAAKTGVLLLALPVLAAVVSSVSSLLP
ncbi:MAG: stage III sporulation protein AD [Firmicutes bacterium]|nr:stage III sporulation protein AD [Bacillota bacterium]